MADYVDTYIPVYVQVCAVTSSYHVCVSMVSSELLEDFCDTMKVCVCVCVCVCEKGGD